MAVTPPPQTSFVETMEVLLVNSGLRLVLAVVILSVGWVGATWAKRWTEAGLRRLPIDATLKPLLASLVRYAILLITMILVLEQFGVQIASLIAVLAGAGLAIGLAMQGTLSNVAAGLMLLILRPFRVGHFIEAAGQSGTVREIGLFTTLVTTRDLVYVSIPNSAIFSAVTINYTREPIRRVRFAVTVDIANDLGKVAEVIERSLAANKYAVASPPASAVVDQLLEYSVVMSARAHVRSLDYWAALHAMQLEVKAALAGADILFAATRQAPVVRNEPASDITAPPAPG